MTDVQFPNAMALGDDIDEREGRVVECTSLQIRGYIEGVSMQTNDPSFVRVMVIWDYWPNATAFAIGDILATTGTAEVVISLRNRDVSAQSRFKVLKDWRTSIGGLTNATSNKKKKIDWFFDLKKMCGGLTRWDAAGSAETDIQRGKLIIWATSDTAAMGDGPTIVYKSRLNFIDP